MYKLVDGTGTAFPGAYTLNETFSDIQKTPTDSGLKDPTATSIDIAAGNYAGDTQYAGYPYPAVLGYNEHASYKQLFTAKVGTTTYSLTTVVTISLGKFNGTLQDNVTITTP